MDNLEKNATGTGQEEKKGIFKKLAEMFGFDVVEKGSMGELYEERNRSNQFWTAFYALQDTLCYYDTYTSKEWFEEDDTKIKEALSEFGKIISDVLAAPEPVTKSIAKDKPVLMFGKKLSGKNRETLQGIYETLGSFIASFDDADEEQNTPEEKKPPEGAEEPEDGKKEKEEEEETEVKKEEVEKLVQESVAAAVEKALGEAQPAASEETITAEAVQKMVEESVKKAVKPILKARGVPSALNETNNGNSVEKSEEHYLHGIL